MCDNAKENCPDSNFTVLDITVSVPEKKYDIVMESAVIQVTSNWRQALKNILAASNKWFIAHRFFSTNAETRIEQVETYRKVEDIRVHVGTDEFKRILLECGFELVSQNNWVTEPYTMGTFIAKRICE